MWSIRVRCSILLVAAGACVSSTRPNHATEGLAWEETCEAVLADSRWRVARDNWSGDGSALGEQLGGVVPENLMFASGHCQLIMRGTAYAGNVRGVDGQGRELPDGRSSGAAVATRRTFGSGTFEARLRVPAVPGFVVGMWTLHYSEVPVDPWFDARETIVRNHEIDIEILHRDSNHTEIWASTAVGVAPDAKTTRRLTLPSLAGEFHVFAFEWQSGPDPSVQFKLDGRHLTTIRTHVPTIAGHLWLGAWAPREWAGTPGFVSSIVDVDWVRVRPMPRESDEYADSQTEGFLWAAPTTGTPVPQ